MRDNAIALRRNTTPTTPPTLHPKNRNVAASSIRDPLKLKSIQPLNVRPRGTLIMYGSLNSKCRTGAPSHSIVRKSTGPVRRYGALQAVARRIGANAVQSN
jgi:hypothetical protein